MMERQQQQLIQACYQGNVDRIRELCRESETSAAAAWEYHKLACAAESSSQVLQVLLDEFGCKFLHRRLLHNLVSVGNIKALRLVVAHSPNYYWYEKAEQDSASRIPSRVNPLMFAIRIGADLAFIKCLVEEAMIPVNARGGVDETALDMVRRRHDYAPVVNYLESLTDIVEACRAQNHAEMERLLKSQGVPANFCLSRRRNGIHKNLVHVAFEAADTTAVQILLQYGAKLCATDLHAALAERQEREEFLRWLCLQPTVEVNALWEGKSPLEMAVQENMCTAAKIFVQEGAHVENTASVELHKSLLFRACDHGCVDMVRILLRHGASCAQQTKRGWSALHQACRKGYTSIVEAMVTHNPEEIQDILWGSERLDDGEWRSPLRCAADLGYLDIVQLLIVHRIVEQRRSL